MQIVVNGEPRETGSSNVAELLAEMDIEPSRAAVEKNRDLVPRAKHAETPLSEGDRIEIVTLVGGG